MKSYYRLENLMKIVKENKSMVRFAQEKDLNRINELRKQVNDIHVAAHPDVFKAGFGRELQDFARVLLTGENSDILVAEREGILCGMACVDYVRKPETPYGMGRSFYHIQEIAVDKSFRRQGVAKELFEFMKEDAKKRLIDKIELSVWSFNESAIEFYESVGFYEIKKCMAYNIT